MKEYSKIGNLLTKGRLGGIVDWDAIEDRVRVPDVPYFNSNVEQAVSDAVHHFRLDRTIGQGVHVELWVEKDAISNIMSRVTHHYGVRLMVNRGYSSTTAMFDAYNRIQDSVNNGKECTILYLGDHDPSGLDMVSHDIPNRLNDVFGTEVSVIPIAITKRQIDQYDPPPNPAKISDPRAKWYIENYGKSSWEVDALEPNVLHNIVKDSIEKHLDMDVFNSVMVKEEKMRTELKKLPEMKNRVVRLGEFLKKTSLKKMPIAMIKKMLDV